MIPRECKRLAEVDFPIRSVSKHAVKEKSIRHGHPSTLHLWWARRPLASSRAVLLGLLWPDPCDPRCPQEFKQKARALLPHVAGANPGTTDTDLRRALLRFIGDFANWDFAAQRTYLEVSRALVRAAHGEEPPLVVDPFAGGGSIPIEALRLACEAFATDLNPVACLMLKVMLEDIPRHGPQLADELRSVGAEIKQRAESELSDVYPKDVNGAVPIAYLWARTVCCEAPSCGAEIPLLRSMWLCKKAKRRRALRCSVVRPADAPPRVEFDIFEPAAESDVSGGTVSRARATCLCCGKVLRPDRVRAQLSAQRGGANVAINEDGRRMGARMFAVVTIKPGEQGRFYRLPDERDHVAVRKAHDRLAALVDAWERSGKRGLHPVPDEAINPIRPSPNARGLSAVTRYGIARFGDLFTARQIIALLTLVNQLRSALGEKHQPLLACALSRVVMSSMACTRWNAVAEKMQHTFGRQALPMIWDFAGS